MAKPSKEFRENSDRAVFVTGEIDERLVHQLMPGICRLRGQSNDPITAYIDSRGGSTLSTEHLRSLFKAPSQDGKTCRLITVATTRAASAAADLLALGDYAIAYPRAVIHCHGTRLSAVEITKESAQSLAAWYFVVALCRLLQQGENRLTGLDAYRLGLVDEVVGARLPSLRLVAENPDV